MSRDAALARLRHAQWRDSAAPFFDCLEGAAGATRAVGGIVRDTLLGVTRSRTDIDLATTLTPQQVMDRAKVAGLGVHPTGVEHGTVTLVAHGVAAEVTTLRKDVETYGRHARVVFGTDWRADASRRDFTMNALYAGADGDLFDPLSGLDDCLGRRVRFIGDPAQRIAEDRLRVYRYFRFCASHGGERFDGAALAACAEAARDLSMLSAERVGQEMTRLLALPRIADTLAAMVGAGLLPDILDGGDLQDRFVRYERLCPEPELAGRLAIILAGGITGDALQMRWRLASRTMRQASDGLDASRALLADRTSEVAYRWPDGKRGAVYLAAALADKPRAWVDRHLEILAELNPPPFPVDGQDLMALGYKPGATMGAELERLKRLWFDRNFVPDKAALLALATPPDADFT